MILVALASIAAVPADAFSFTFAFSPRCSPIPDSPPRGFKRWSDPALWAPASVPGVGRRVGANVTIPCGVAVLLDVPSLLLHTLEIRGLLKVADSGPGRVYDVRASFIIVEGQLVVGSPAVPFRSHITFTLLPNPHARLPFIASFNPPSAINVGHKAFAVVGGQVRLHGMPGSSRSPSWVRLNANAPPGVRTIVVDVDVSRLWQRGSIIAIASTDYYPNHSELLTVLSVRPYKGGATIFVDKPLQYNHFGDPRGVPDGFGGFVDERAEVALLSRNIVLRGAEEGAPWELEGGHFAVFMTQAPQQIEGVEFVGMGQQGTLGRYPLHFHVCGNTAGLSVVRKNSIHDSKQRCVVVHATHNLTIDSTVTYNTSGHCFLLEEGGEQDNTFINNLGIITKAVTKKIAPDESDGQPSIFWITNMKNNYINNVAVGADDSGYWTELRFGVRGISMSIPSLTNLVPIYTNGGNFTGNVAHSNVIQGFRCYPSGVRPRTIQDKTNKWPSSLWPHIQQRISGLRIYKHRLIGMFMASSEWLVITNSVFADNGLYGIEARGNCRGVIANSTFVGVTPNVGNPFPLSYCSTRFGGYACAPIVGCQFPPQNVSNLRFTGWSHWLNPSFGIMIEGLNYRDVESPNGIVINCKFSNYDPSCKPAGGIGFGIGMPPKDWWDAGQSFQNIQSTPETPPIWFPPASTLLAQNYHFWYPGVVESQELVYRDRDGSVVGGNGGYVVTNMSTFLYPPPRLQPNCALMPYSNAYKCKGVCYRTLYVEYVEDAFQPFSLTATVNDTLPPGSRWRAKGDYSYLTLVRAEDGVSRDIVGNLNCGDGDGGRGPWRFYYFTILANQTYDLYIQPPTNNPSFWPTNVTIYFKDGFDGQDPCPGYITVRILPRGITSQWTLIPNPLFFWSPCPGMTWSGNSTQWPVQATMVCYNQMSVLQLTLSPDLRYWDRFTLVSTPLPVQQCLPTRLCGVLPDSDWYFFNDSGAELHGRNGFQAPAFDHSSWGYGQAIIGFVQYVGPPLNTVTQPGGVIKGVKRITQYFRRPFTLTKPSCFSGIVLDYIPFGGLAVHLNGFEVFRFNVLGNLTAYTYNTVTLPNYPKPLFNTTVINTTAVGATFVEGTNVLAFETHMGGGYSYYFDSRVALIASSSC